MSMNTKNHYESIITNTDNNTTRANPQEKTKDFKDTDTVSLALSSNSTTNNSLIIIMHHDKASLDNVEEYTFQSFDSLEPNHMAEYDASKKIVNTWIEVKKISPIQGGVPTSATSIGNNNRYSNPFTNRVCKENNNSIKIKPNKYHPNAYQLPGLSIQNGGVTVLANVAQDNNSSTWDMNNRLLLPPAQYCCPKSLMAQAYQEQENLYNEPANSQETVTKHSPTSAKGSDWTGKLKKFTTRSNKKSYNMNPGIQNNETYEPISSVILNKSKQHHSQPIDYRNEPPPMNRNIPSRGTIMLRSRQMAAKLEQENDSLDQNNNNNEKEPPNPVEEFTLSPMLTPTASSQHQSIINKTNNKNRILYDPPPPLPEDLGKQTDMKHRDPQQYAFQLPPPIGDSLGQSKSLSTTNLNIEQQHQEQSQTQIQNGLTFKALRQRWSEYINQNSNNNSRSMTKRCPCKSCGSSDKSVIASRLCPRSLIQDNDSITFLRAPLRVETNMAMSCDNLVHLTRANLDNTKEAMLTTQKRNLETFWENAHKIDEKKIPTKPPIFNQKNVSMMRELTPKDFMQRGPLHSQMNENLRPINSISRHNRNLDDRIFMQNGFS